MTKKFLAQPPLPVRPEQEPVAKVVSTAPDRIWLDLGFDPQDEYEVVFHELHDVTWSQDNASGNGIEYVRADITPPLLVQPERQPLTDEQIEIALDQVDLNSLDWIKELRKFARTIEAAHNIKEKNNG